MALCSSGGAEEGYEMMVAMSKRVKDPMAFAAFLEQYYEFEMKDEEEELAKSGEEEVDMASLMSIGRGKHLKTRAYCKSEGFKFDECTLLEKVANDARTIYLCGMNCMHDLLDDDGFCPSYDMMAISHQDLLACVLDFDQGQVTIDAQHGIDIQQAASMLQRYGFVAFKNFFSTERMKSVHDILLDWRKVGDWDGRRYTDYMAKDHLHEPELREEIVVPHTEPFLSILEEIKQSEAWHVMEQYVGLPGLEIEIATSILSDPGAGSQTIHSDFAVPGRMLKGNLALHSMKRGNGPTGFCPCTHSRALFYRPYALSPVECPLHFQPETVDAGTFVIYDQALEHHGMMNLGDDTRYILDISYIVGEIDDEYIQNFSPVAGEAVMEIRSTFSIGGT